MPKISFNAKLLILALCCLGFIAVVAIHRSGWAVEIKVKPPVVKPTPIASPTVINSHIIWIDRHRTLDLHRLFPDGNWKIEEQDPVAYSLKTIDVSRIIFDTALKADEIQILGTDKLQRIKDSGCIRLDIGAFLSMWEEKSKTTLEWLYKEKKITYIDFFGTVLKDPSGNLCILSLQRDNVRDWKWGTRRLNLLWTKKMISAILNPLCRRPTKKIN